MYNVKHKIYLQEHDNDIYQNLGGAIFVPDSPPLKYILPPPPPLFKYLILLIYLFVVQLFLDLLC